METKLPVGLIMGSLFLAGSLLGMTAAVAEATPITSVVELSDIAPTDWAFQALQSLVERFDCKAGYPDRTFRGNRALTRFEFAAGLNACFHRVDDLVKSGQAEKVTQEDLAVLQRLQEEYQGELTFLGGRVEQLDAETRTLEDQVFSPLIKLNTEVVAALVFQGLSDDIRINNAVVVSKSAASATLNYRVRMTFSASLFGRDRLSIRLQAREFNTTFFPGDVGLAEAAVGGSNNIVLNGLIYRFPLFTNAVTATIGITGTDVGNVFLYDVPLTALSRFVSAPSLTHTPIISGTTLGFTWRISDMAALSYAYSTNSAGFNGRLGQTGLTTPSAGLFNGDSIHAAELTFEPSDTLSVHFAFAHQYFVATFIGGTPARVIEFTEVINGFTIATNWELSPSVVFTGWYGKATRPQSFGEFDSFLIGLGFNDLFIEGAQGGIAYGLPLDFTDSTFPRRSVLDVYYSFPIGNFLTLTPGFYIVSSPLQAVNNSNDPSVIVGAIRANFNF